MTEDTQVANTSGSNKGMLLAFGGGILVALVAGVIIYSQSNIIKTMTGVVTQLAPDCSDLEELRDGKVYITTYGVPCDGGSSLTVDGMEILTSSGMTIKGWAKSTQGVHAGDTVRVSYRERKSSATYSSYDLNCSQCKVEIVAKRSAAVPVVEQPRRSRF